MEFAGGGSEGTIIVAGEGGSGIAFACGEGRGGCAGLSSCISSSSLVNPFLGQKDLTFDLSSGMSVVLVDRPGNSFASKKASLVTSVHQGFFEGSTNFHPFIPSSNPTEMHFLVCESRFFLFFLGIFTKILQLNVQYMLIFGFLPFHTLYEVVSDSEEEGVALRMWTRYRRA